MGEDVVFWKWITDTMLALISENSIYQWDIAKPSQAPVILTERHPSLVGSQIINYHVTNDDKWHSLCGIAQENGIIVGHIQLFSKERNISQAIEGHASAFGLLRLDGATSDSKLFAFANKTLNGAKMHIVEIDYQDGNPLYQTKAVNLYVPPELPNDFPVSVEVSDKYGIIYLITKYGLIHLYDLESGACIFMNRISSDFVFTATKYDATSGVVAMNGKGQVLSVSINEDTIIPYILNNLGNSSLALSLASRSGFEADSLYQH